MTPPRPLPLVRRLAVGAGVLAVVAIAAVVVLQPLRDDRSAVPPFVVAQNPEPRQYPEPRQNATLFKIVGSMLPCPGDPRTVIGTDGARIEISACLDPLRPPLDVGPERTLYFAVHLRNTGHIRTPATIASGTSLLDKSGTTHMADLPRSLPAAPDPAAGPQLEPSEQADLTLVVPARRDAEPLLLVIVHPMAGTPAAEWIFD